MPQQLISWISPQLLRVLGSTLVPIYFLAFDNIFSKRLNFFAIKIQCKIYRYILYPTRIIVLRLVRHFGALVTLCCCLLLLFSVRTVLLGLEHHLEVAVELVQRILKKVSVFWGGYLVMKMIQMLYGICLNWLKVRTQTLPSTLQVKEEGSTRKIMCAYNPILGKYICRYRIYIYDNKLVVRVANQNSCSLTW